METPACAACNGGTKKLERAAALFAHIRMVDNRTRDQQKEHRAIARGVSADFPGWQREFYSDPDHEDAGRLPADVKPMNVGPLMQDALCTVAAKLAFALHYRHTGKIVPRTGFVSVRFETNVTIQSRELPVELVAMLGRPQMLTQGKWTSEGHFAYRGAWVPDGTGSVFIAHLGEAFFFLMFAIAQHAGSDEPQLEMSEFKAMRHFRPNDMQKADAVALARYNTPGDLREIREKPDTPNR